MGIESLKGHMKIRETDYQNILKGKQLLDLLLCKLGNGNFTWDRSE